MPSLLRLSYHSILDAALTVGVDLDEGSVEEGVRSI